MEQNKNLKKDYAWNMIGSVCYSLSSFVYLMLVTRICGTTEAGVFALAFSTAQLLLTFGRYGMRTYQATDTHRLYTFPEYGATRIFTCAGMMLLSLPYCLFMGYSLDKLLIFFWVAGMKMLDASEDVYHGELQRCGHVAQMGQMLAIRNLFSCLIFAAALISTRALIFTCAITFFLSLVFCQAVNTWAVRRFCPLEKGLSWKRVRALFVICFPIFLSTFLSLFLYNIPKYAIDFYLSEDIQTYYNVLFMPSFVITLFSEIVTKPMLTTLSIAWEDDLRQFTTITRRIYALIALGTVGVVLGGHFLGRWLLELFYGVDLEPYKLHFVVLLIGGGLSAAAYISYNILISIRFQQFIIITYLAVAVVASPLTYWAVSRWGMMGAACSYLAACLALALVFLAVLLFQCRKQAAKNRELR